MPENAYPYHEGSSHIRTFTQKITPRELGEQLPREAGVHRSVGNRHASKTHILSPDTFPGASQASEMRTLSTKVRQTRVPSARKSAPKTPASVKNAYPQPKSASNMRSLSPKVNPQDPGGCQKRVLSGKKCVKNTYP